MILARIPGALIAPAVLAGTAVGVTAQQPASGAGQPGANPNAQPPPIEAITAAESDAPARKLVKCT